ncbi:MAG TPA: hypothetical protein P5514_11150 [Bacteroidales bacterium]|nr:hypothetical protein [Bacteroidales bacterium]HRX97494.1 hypothetical protein [Bacteroidales bacterium]
MKTITIKQAIISGIIFIIVVSFFTYVKYHRYHQGLSIVVSSDAEGYNQYLTAVFIHNDIFHQPYSFVLEDGRFFNKYNYGVALLQSPFYIVSHLVSKLFGLPNDGKLNAYIVGVILCGVFYAYLGLLLLFKLLRRKFSLKTTLITLGILFLGTNLVFYTYREPGMSHVYAFFLISLFIYSVHKYYDQPGWTAAIIMAVALGILALIRLPHLLIGIYLVLFRVSSFRDLRKNLHFLSNYWVPLISIPLAIVLFYIPQSLYWHALTGKIFVNPYHYSNVAEGFFFWNNPQFKTVLFGPHGGWLLYSPLVLLAFAGVVYQFRKRVGSPWAVSIILLTTTYLYASWWLPSLAASFGHRGFVDIYPVLAFPMAWIADRILRSGILLKTTFYSLAGLLVYLSVFMSFNFKYPWWNQDWGYGTYLDFIGMAFFLVPGIPI